MPHIKFNKYEIIKNTKYVKEPAMTKSNNIKVFQNQSHQNCRYRTNQMQNIK